MKIKSMSVLFVYPQSNSRSIDLSNTASVRSTPPHSIPSRRVVASSSIDLYSKNNVEESYDARVNRVTPRFVTQRSEYLYELIFANCVLSLGGGGYCWPFGNLFLVFLCCNR